MFNFNLQNMKINVQIVLMTCFCLLFFTNNINSQNYPSIKIDGDEVLVSDNSKFPYWIKSGQTLEIGSNVKLISVLQYAVSAAIGGGNNLLFEDVVIVKNLQTVPSGKVWKVESVGLDMSAVVAGATGTTGTANSCPPANAGETLIEYNGCLYVKNVDESGTYTWVDALTQCTGLGSGWYLPNMDELNQLYLNWNQPSNGGTCKEFPATSQVLNLQIGTGVLLFGLIHMLGDWTPLVAISPMVLRLTPLLYAV